MKKTLLLSICILIGGQLAAQQLPDRSLFQETAYLWNPAITGTLSYWSMGATYRQQWLGFEDAPRTMTLQGQYPFERDNMALGGFFRSDQVLPLRSNALGVNYAYHAEMGRRGMLSFGIQASITQYFFDASNIRAQNSNDFLLPAGENIRFLPNATLGFFFKSDHRDPHRYNYFYIGAAAQQLLPSNLIFDDFGGPANLKREIHGNAIIGGHFNGQNGYLEPSAWISYSRPSQLDVNIGLKYERYDSFWAGLAYNVNNTLGLQLGYILSEGFVGDGSLRIGTLGTYNIGSFGPFRGLGYEFFVAYQFEL